MMGSKQKNSDRSNDRLDESMSLGYETQGTMSSLIPCTSLHRKTPSLSAYQTTPIEKHYELNNQILAAFESHYEQGFLSTAYAFGFQFLETALFEIPKHGYYNSTRPIHSELRMQSSLDALRVAQKLKELQADADRNNLDMTFADHIRLSKLADLALAQIDEAQDSYEAHRVKAEAEIRTPEHYMSPSAAAGGVNTNHKSWMICAEPMLASCSDMFCPSSQGHGHQQYERQSSIHAQKHNRPPISPTRESLHHKPHNEWERSSDTAKSPHRAVDSLPPAMSPQPARPTYAWLEDIIQHDKNNKNDARNSLSTGNNAVVTQSSTATTEMPSQTAASRFFDNSGALPSYASGFGDQQNSKTMNQNSSAPFLGVKTVRRLTSSFSGDDVTLERALFVSGLEVSTSGSYAGHSSFHLNQNEFSGGSDHAVAMKLLDNSYGTVREENDEDPLQAESSNILQFTMLSHFYREDFDHLCKTGQIRVSFADTYQGRVKESTNGCTVIAPLLCIHHLLEDQCPDPGLSDSIIVHVIDDETPAILKQLRQELGLSAQAFLIPSDAHDYFIDNGQLNQKQFINVTGGNILDEGHLAAFVNALVNENSNKRVAATFFFHEHVVAILKLKRDRRGKEYWYDLIDSLPLKQTLCPIGGNNKRYNKNSSIYYQESEGYISSLTMSKSARVRCLNAEALTACLRWYACSRFGNDNVTYIDQYPWTDGQSDFDPRVFQGFVWGTLD